MQNKARRSHKTNSPNGYRFGWQCGGFYSYPNTNDYELFNDFDLGFTWNAVKGQCKCNVNFPACC